MDVKKLNQLRKKLEGKSSGSMLLKLEEGKQKIRIIPNKYEPEVNFQSLKFHYNVGQRSILCLKNFDEECPICNLVSELFKSDKDSDTLVAKSIMAKDRYYTPVVKRNGNKNEGPYWFSLNNTNLKVILDHFDDFPNLIDVEKGNDFNVNFIKKKPFNETTLTISRQSELCDDPDEAQKIIDSVPDIMEYYERFKMNSNKIEEVLDDYINGSSSEKDAEEVKQIKEDEEVEEKDSQLSIKINKLIEEEDDDE